MPDTTDRPVEAVREVRDLIQARVEQFIPELIPELNLAETT